MILLFLACKGGAESAPPVDSPGDDSAEASPCPAGMALAGEVCVDRWEAALEGHSPYEVPTSGTAVSAVGQSCAWTTSKGRCSRARLCATSATARQKSPNRRALSG